MIRRWLALTYYLYALRLAALSHFYFNRLYKKILKFIIAIGYICLCFITARIWKYLTEK